eukprot:gene7902-9277_t
MIKQKFFDAPIDLQFKTERAVSFKLGDQEYAASLLDLPCILESHKTLDKTTYYKTADIGQIIQVHDNDDTTTPAAYEAAEFKSTSGITPPTKDITKKRFREVSKEKVTAMAKIEEELVRIIKPGYTEQEEIEFITLDELRDIYGPELFNNMSSTEPIIFEEPADDQVTLDDIEDQDSADEDDMSDNENPLQIRTIKIKTSNRLFNRSTNRMPNFDDDEMLGDEYMPPVRQTMPIVTAKKLHHQSPSPGHRERFEGERSPVDKTQSAPRERKTRSDKGKERVPHYNVNFKQQAAALAAQQQQQQPVATIGQHIPEIKVRIPSLAAAATSSAQMDTDFVGGFKMPEEKRTSVLSPLSAESSAERKKRRKERREKQAAEDPDGTHRHRERKERKEGEVSSDTIDHIQLLSALRKATQEAESIKKRLDEAQSNFSSIPNPVLRKRQQIKIDEQSKLYNAKLKEIEVLEAVIHERGLKA